MNLEASINSKYFKPQTSESHLQSEYRSNTRLDDHLLKTGNKSWKNTNSQQSLASIEKKSSEDKIGGQNSIRQIVETKGPEVIIDRALSKSSVRIVRKADVISPEHIKNSV